MRTVEIVCVFVILSSLFMILRVTLVGHYRLRLLANIKSAADLDFAAHNYDYEWRYKQFETVSFNRMVYQFWKPIDSFYTDKRFVMPSEETEPA